MNLVATDAPPCHIKAMTQMGIAKVREMEAEASRMPQLELETDHLFHAGCYTRTVVLPAGTFITGALIKIATVIIITGTVRIYVDDGDVQDHTGYNVFAAEANRKQAFYAFSDVTITMIFPTSAQTVEAAEAEFTDEAHLLITNCKEKQLCQVLQPQP